MSSENPNTDRPSTETSPRLRYWYPLPKPERVEDRTVDLCVYGATPAGIAAVIQARRMGKTAVLLSFDGHVGGMTASGLGATDIGNKAVIGGIAREFYRALGGHYGKDEMWTFEPHVAEAVLYRMLQGADAPVLFHQRLDAVKKSGARITEIRTEGGHRFRAKYFVDATYEGDLLARAGVSYTVGREANVKYGETLNGVHFGHPGHNFKVPVDPFVRPGDPASGLLPGIAPDPPGHQGDGDHRVQAYNFRVCLTKAENRLPFPKPDGYDPAQYELFARYIRARDGLMDALNLTIAMPNGKTDTNNYGGFSSDFIGGNYRWPDADYAERERIFQKHVSYNQGMYWFLCHDDRVPASVRETARASGLPADEFIETGGWPFQLYVREGRRMISDLVMTEKHCRHAETVPDAIGMAAYTMDSHNCQRVAREENGVWTARNEGNVEVPPSAPYPVGYRAIVPAAGQCDNLLVGVCLSASHIAYGSIRMEPVFFVLGQSCATAACLAMDSGDVPVQKVNIAQLQARLTADGQILRYDPPKAEGK